METFILSLQDTPLIVHKGGVDLFYKTVKTGKLHPLTHIDEGQVVFGFADNIDTAEIQLIGQPLPQSELDMISLAELSANQRQQWFKSWQKKFPSLIEHVDAAYDAHSLQQFNHQVWLCCLAEHKAHREVFHHHIDQAKSYKSSAMSRVEAMMRGPFQKSSSHLTDVDGQEDISKALSMVARYLGVKIELDATSLKPNETYLRYLQRTCDMSGLHLRMLKLTGHWWRQCTDPMIVFTEDDQPIVVLPTRGGRCQWILVETGQAIKPNIEMANTLQPIGLGLHAAFPSEGRVGVKEMLKVGFRHNGWDMIALIIFALVIAGLGALPPILVGKLVGDAIPNNQIDYLIELPLILLVSAVVIFGFNLIKEILIIKITTRSTIQLQSALLHRVLRLPVNFFQRYNTGELTNRVLSFQEISQTFSGTQINVVFTVVFGAVNLVVMFVYLPLLALFVTGFVIIYVLMMSVFSYYRVKIIAQYMEYEAKAGGFAFQLLKGIAKLKSTATEALGLHQWSAIFSPSQRCQYQLNRLTKWENLVSQSVSLFVLVIVYLLIASGLVGGVNVAQYAAFNSAYLQFFAAMASVTVVLNDLLRARVQLKRAQPILTAATEQHSASQVLAQPQLQGGITLSDVCFSYRPDKGQMILKNIDCKIEPGQFVAIVGESGGGKSTLFRLLLGFEQPTTGNILYDGYRMDDVDRQYVRRQLGVVLQQAKVFGGSILDNIVGTNIELAEEDAWQVAKLAGLSEDIEAMPMGMHTILPEGGGVLSGGQRQRLLIARALALQPKILLLDEATSALDNKTQQTVMDSIQSMQSTRIVIAHRLSTIEHADIILVLDQGEIVERGDYDSLMAQQGLFYRLAQRQL